MENQRTCRRCLTRDMAGKEEYFRNLTEYIENLDEELRTNKEQYEERLGICKECDLLLEGMCRSCGCYVELRAATAKNSCPNKKWFAIELSL
ncbi:DUF6171 family protein [Lachnospiraceae bacterium OttesenSCG-928-D06]|nr:DUF6171 family protein [Lachnospiraceae bacterium OttesenSCG-928-D06]